MVLFLIVGNAVAAGWFVYVDRPGMALFNGVITYMLAYMYRHGVIE